MQKFLQNKKYTNVYIMELAIPLIALGGLYIISNQPSSQNKNVNSKNVNSKNINYKNVNSQKENFSTRGKNPNY